MQVVNPKTCSFNILVKSVACGLDHTHLLSKDGFLYSMGSNDEGKLGLSLSPKELPHSTSPRLIESVKHVKAVACGLSHSLAIVREGGVYGWGRAENGQIGMRLERACQPVEVKFDKECKLSKVACGARHSAFLTSKGEALMCGLGAQGQLGVGYLPQKEYRPTKALLEEKVLDIQCGDMHTGFLTESGRVFMTGDNSVWQLGCTQQTILFTPRPLLVQSLAHTQVKQLSCSNLGSYSAALTIRNELYVWGNYQTGSTAMLPVMVEMPVECRALREIQTSKTLIAALDKSNRLWVWSATSPYGQEGFKGQPSLVETLRKHRIRRVFMGSQYILAMGDNVGETPKPIEQSSIVESYQLNNIKGAQKKKLQPKSVSIESQLSLQGYLNNQIDENQPVNISIYMPKHQHQALSDKQSCKSSIERSTKRNHFCLAPRSSDPLRTNVIINGMEYPARFKRITTAQLRTQSNQSRATPINKSRYITLSHPLHTPSTAKNSRSSIVPQLTQNNCMIDSQSIQQEQECSFVSTIHPNGGSVIGSQHESALDHENRTLRHQIVQAKAQANEKILQILQDADNKMSQLTNAHQQEKQALISANQVLVDNQRKLQEQVRQQEERLTVYQREIGEQLNATEKFVEALLQEKEVQEMEVRSQLLQAQSEKARIEEELHRLRRTHEAMRHEFRTIQEENASILDENQRLRRERNQLRSEDREKYHTFMQKFQSPPNEARLEYNDEMKREKSKEDRRSKSIHNRSQSWNNNENNIRDPTSPLPQDDRDSMKTVEDYNFHLLKSIQKMAANRSGNRSSNKSLPKLPNAHHRLPRHFAMNEMDLQQILKATTAGEETFTEKELITSLREDSKENTHSSLNLQDLFPHFNHDLKEGSGRINLANLRLDVIRKANISEGGVISGARDSSTRGPVSAERKQDNIVSIRSALTNLEIPSMRERLLGKIKQKATGSENVSQQPPM